MRIAPFAFWDDYSREDIRDFCRITHRNEEAYVGTLAVIICIRQILNNNWNGENNLIELILSYLPDTNVRDRLTELNKLPTDNAISEAAVLGTNGYVVNSIPFAIFCASQAKKIGMENMYQQIIDSGGDTDTNASIAGQIVGTLVGEENLPLRLKEKIRVVHNFEWISRIINNAKEKLP